MERGGDKAGLGNVPTRLGPRICLLSSLNTRLVFGSLYSVSFKLPVQSRLVNIVTVESRISDDFTAKLMISVQSHPDRARKITSLYVVTQDHKSYQRLRPQTTAGGAVGQSRPRVGWLGPPVPPVTLVLPSIKISISRLSVHPARFSGLADGDDADLQLISFGIYLQISACGANLS